MKFLIYIALLGGIGFAGWHFYPQLLGKMEEGVVRLASDSADEGEPDESDGGESSAASTRGGSSTSDSVPGTAASNLPTAAELENRYPMPNFRSLDEVAGNWTNIPKSAFPRQITLKEPVTYAIAGGEGKMLAGAKVWAFSGANGVLTVGPSKAAKLRGSIAIDKTDFKQLLGAVYERFKDKKRKAVIAQRASAKKQALDESKNQPVVASSDSSSSSSSGGSDPIWEKTKATVGPKPEQNRNRSVPVMIASIEAGEVKEIKLEKIDAWGRRVRMYIYEGEPYWSCTVQYKTKNLFGEFATEAIALIRYNKVIKWIYTGSEETVR